MSVTIYGMALTRAGRCLWAAEEIGLAYDHKSVDMFAGEHKSPEFLAINPNGKLPAMKDGDLDLFESMAINTYLADTYGKGGLQPDTAADRARANQWSHWVMAECETPLLHGLLHALGIMGFAQDAAKVREQRDALEPKLAVLNQALAGRDYLLGGRFTVADLNVASVFQWGQVAGMDWGQHSNFAAWLNRCLSRPAFLKVAEMAKADMAKMNG